MRITWTARRSNQSILKRISPGCSLEGVMLKLKLQYFDHLMWRVDSLEKTLMLGGIGGRRRRGQQRMRWLDGITAWVWVSSGSWWWTGRPGVLRFMRSQRVGHNWATELNWTKEYYFEYSSSCSYSCSPFPFLLLFFNTSSLKTVFYSLQFRENPIVLSPINIFYIPFLKISWLNIFF